MVDTYNLGVQTSDMSDLIKPGALSISELVDLVSYNQMEFLDAVNIETTNTLDVHKYFRDKKQGGVFRINEQAHSPYLRQTTFDKVMHLKKYRAGVELDDESLIRMDQSVQLKNSIELAGSEFAEQRDNEILESLLTAVADTNAVKVTATAKWDTANCDISGDLGRLLDALFTTDDVRIKEQEINNIVVYYPLKLYSQIREPAKFFATSSGSPAASRIQVNTTDLDWARNTYGITWVGSHRLNYVGKALCIIKSPYTADHYSYNGGAIPAVNQGYDPFGGLQYWINTRYFGTMVYPNSYEVRNTNYRIMAVSTVCDPVTASE